MENNIRFRNHASVILENSLKAISTMFFIFIMNIASELGDADVSITDILWILGLVAVVLVIVLGYQWLIWSKTYITIEENTLVVERNTLNKKRNTIGLKNVSNINLEQNILEMLLGTCKVKLDTNSLSTAEETDVKIILKKSDAERFRQLILGKEDEETAVTSNEQEEKEKVERKHISDIGDVILHGVFSIRIVSVILLVGITLMQGWLLAEEGVAALGDNIIEILMSLIVAFWLFAGILWGMIKEFVKYIGFVIERKGDKIYLTYGLLKRVAYSIPVEKINGIKLVQTPIARIGKRYMVEVINVGMDDDENEANTFFLPYAKKEKIEQQLQMILPEFAGCTQIKENKQPKSIWLIWMPTVVIYFIIAVIGCLCAVDYDPELTVPVVVAAIVVAVWFLILKIASYLTKGTAVDEKFLKIVDGRFEKRILFVKYDKIQYIIGKQNPIASHFKVQKATITLLASLKNRIHEIPYFHENEMEELKKHLI